MERYSSGTVPLSSSATGWVKRITNILHTETAINNIDHLPPVSVLQVPGTIAVQKPEAYAPQLIAMGPYHHLNPELYQMERYKLASIKSLSTSPDQVLNFQGIVVDRLKELDPSVRACYNKFLDYDRDTLAWIVAIDGCFFLHVADSYVDDDDDNVDRKLMENTIITRDIMMLENQIPFVVLKEIRKALNGHEEGEEDLELELELELELVGLLLRLCESISPVKLSFGKINPYSFRKHMPLHLLDLMYRVIVNVAPDDVKELGPHVLEVSTSPSSSSSDDDEEKEEEEEETEAAVHENLDEILDLVESTGTKSTEKIIRPVRILSSIPWSSISGVFRQANLSHKDQDYDDKIEVPSVSHLWKYAKVQCRPLSGRIDEIRFDVVGRGGAILYLPVLNLNASAEVIFRNLVAYEAAVLPEESNLEFARYINLMNGIVDTAEDVKLLKQNGVIEGSLKDKEIAEMFNGMRRCHVGFGDQKKEKSNNIDIAIQEMNRYYDRKLVVKVVKQLKRELTASWKWMALFSTAALVILMCIQTFCDFYQCNGIRMWR